MSGLYVMKCLLFWKEEGQSRTRSRQMAHSEEFDDLNMANQIFYLYFRSTSVCCNSRIGHCRPANLLETLALPHSVFYKCCSVQCYSSISAKTVSISMPETDVSPLGLRANA